MFWDFADRIFRIALEINDSTDTARSTSYLEIHLDINNGGEIKTHLYDKRDDFNFPISM